MRFLLLVFTLVGLLSLNVHGEILSKTVEYRDGEVVLEGFVAWDSTKSGQKSPGVLVVHQWMGLTDYEKGRCKQLAELGYVAFALDIYGKGIRPSNPQEAGKQAGVFKNDRALFRKRLQLGLSQLMSRDDVSRQKIAAIGYCFGGTGAIELARSGAPIAGVVSFHGGSIRQILLMARTFKRRSSFAMEPMILLYRLPILKR